MGLVILWGCFIITMIPQHEYWRDEVRALSYAIDSSSLYDLFQRVQDEGHPMLWFLMLYGSYQVTSSKLVLPVLSGLIAALAVILFSLRSPFPLWVKTLFIFSGLSLYEYSVMARNYGISMLLMFSFAWMYPQRRCHPIILAGILALLANTNVHSTILSSLLASLWTWDMRSSLRNRSPMETAPFYLAAVIILCGMSVALYTVWPSGEMIASDREQYTVRHVVRAFLDTSITPAKQFSDLFPASTPSGLASLLLLFSMLGLLVRPAAFLVACAGLWSLSIFFIVVYHGAYRHQGLFICLILTLYWIVLQEGRPVNGRWLHGAYVMKYLGLAVLLGSLAWTGFWKIYDDWHYELTASKALQDLMAANPVYRDAILIGEPDFFLESARYYVNNRVYIVRENRFGYTVRFVRSARRQLNLRELLCSAWEIAARERKPVLIALGHLDVDGIPWEHRRASRSVSYPYHRTFSWTTEDLALWARYTRLRHRSGPNVIGERYDIYTLAPDFEVPGPSCPST